MGTNKQSAVELAQKVAQKEIEGWVPQPMQLAALSCPADEILYGGAAGGGKTDVLIAAALRQANEKTYKGVIFRRTYPELDEVVERARVVIRAVFPEAKESIARHEWRFPNGGKLLFRHLSDWAAAQAHRSAEYQFIGFDELTTFEERQYRYLFTRGRTSKGLKVQVMAATNPGGIGHEWVKKRFAPWLDKDSPVKALPGELLGVMTHPETGEDVFVPVGMEGSLSRTFIPAKLDDNKVLTKADPNYRAKLQSQDPVTRKQLEKGDWDAKPAPKEYFNREWCPVVDASPIKGRRGRGWDRAATEQPTPQNPDPDFTACVKVSYVEEEDLFYIEHAEKKRLAPGGVKHLVVATTKNDGIGCEVVIPTDPASAGEFEAEEWLKALRGFVVNVQKQGGNKVTRAKVVSTIFAPAPGSVYGRFRIVRGPWNLAFLSELEEFPTPGVHDDFVDAFVYVVSVLLQGGGCEGEGGGLTEDMLRQAGIRIVEDDDDDEGPKGGGGFISW